MTSQDEIISKPCFSIVDVDKAIEKGVEKHDSETEGDS